MEDQEDIITEDIIMEDITMEDTMHRHHLATIIIMEDTAEAVWDAACILWEVLQCSYCCWQ